MLETVRNIYEDIANRTKGDIYIGVVGPVRTGKSTFVKRFMELLVIPNIENIYQKERAKDELPQSGSGKTIMTSEPKFVPEDAVSIIPNENSKLSVRLIDSVGYMIPGVSGIIEDGKPRMVTTPWLEEEIPITEAAELGTQKVMETHATVGIVVTTDGSVTDLPREAYLDAERKAIEDMKATGKPFIILINSNHPNSEATKCLQEEFKKKYQVISCAIDLANMDEEQLKHILTCILYEFPVKEFHISLPKWIDALEIEHPVKRRIYEWILENGKNTGCVGNV